ncbi:MAG: hypothetical protein KBF80_14160 [Flavobacteriales bacterium]|nr:hypothetical protein [Flavobacteriales bacterium]
MKYPAILFPFLLLLTQARSQVTFEKYYDAAGMAPCGLNELQSGNLFTGIAFMYGTSLMDPQGNVLHSHCYLVDTVLIIQAVKRVTDNEYYFVSVYAIGANGTDPGGHPLIGKMDSLGNVSVLHYCHFSAATFNGLFDLEVISNKSVIGWGQDQGLIILKADSNLMHVWSKHFAQVGDYY